MNPRRERIRIDRLELEQILEGPRVSQEALLAAREALPHARGRVADLGTGTGILALWLAAQEPRARVIALELSPELARLAAGNTRSNRLESRVTVLRADVRQCPRLLRPRSCRLVVANPPFRPTGTGRISPHPLRAGAEHELTLDLPSTLEAARHLLVPRGALVLIHLAERLAEVLDRLTGLGLEPKRLRCIHHDARSDASTVIVTARAGGRPGLTVLPAAIMRPQQERDPAG